MPERESQYKKIVKYIKEEVADGHLKQGDKLPSEKVLCQRFHLSRQTIRHATGELESEGIITRVRGSGSYVGKRQLKKKLLRKRRQWMIELGLVMRQLELLMTLLV